MNELVIDCDSGEAKERKLTASEVTERKKMAAQAAQEEKAAAAKRARGIRAIEKVFGKDAGDVKDLLGLR